MAAPQTAQPHRPLSTLPLALGSVLVLAKVLAIAGRTIPISVWTIPAFVWHDIAVALGFWAVDRLARRSRWMWAPYAAIVCFAAIDVPITRALSSPLTMPMLRAAGGPLLDSILLYLTWPNVARMAIVIAAGALLPSAFARARLPVRQTLVVTSVVVAAAGPLALARIDTTGLHRNAVTAIITTFSPRVTARQSSADWRTSPFEEPVGPDLTALRGVAKGANVILVALESTAARYLAPYGAADDPTPTVSALARQGILFEHAYAAYPESVKGLFSVLCSHDPAFDEPAESHAAVPCAWLARSLGDAGYRTGLFHSGRFGYLGMYALVDRAGFETSEDAGAIGGQVESSFGVDEPATVKRILTWIDAADRGRPFFVMYMPIAGHHPYATAAPGPFKELTALDAYKNAIHEGDAALAQLMDGLRARGLDRNTIVVLYGDHGQAFAQHEGNFGHSLFLYDENVRVPLIVVGPPSVLPATRVPRIASLIDVAPTILDLLGIQRDPRHHGVSLLAPRGRMALFYTDYSLGFVGLRDACWKFVFELGARRSQLFDVCSDPEERRNLAAEHPDRTGAYADRLERWVAARRAEVLKTR